MFAEILLVLSIIYAAAIIVVAVAASRARYPSHGAIRPTVSVVIAARNEEQNIQHCLNSILALTYPRELLEVIVVDDRSTDATHDIIAQVVARSPHIKLMVAAPEDGHLKGKTNAVTQGIEASSGEIIMFTDADCTVPAAWVEQTVKYYSTQEIGIVAGFTSLRSARLFEAIQAIDWFFLFSVAAAAIRMGSPITAVGNNFSVRRSAYDKVGGYRSIPFSVTEDYALFHAVTEAGGYEARFPIDRTNLVESSACQSLAELFRQKKRWFAGGMDLELKNLISFAFAYIFNFMLLISPFIIDFSLIWLPLSLKITADLTLAIPTLRVFGRSSLLRYFLHFEIYFLLYVILFPIVLLTGNRVVWKDRSY